MKLIILTLFLFLSHSACAYNDEKCRKVAFEGMGWGFLVSTTSYVSSFGPCSAIGSVEHQKELFVAQNLEPLKIDSARGSGEYLNAYLNLSGCNQNKMPHVQKVIQNNFINIFGTDLTNPPEKSYDKLESVLFGACGV